MENIPIIPGRGLISSSATKMRHEYLRSLGCSIDEITNHQLDPDRIQNNIESFIGSVEVPLGIVGPLLFKEKEAAELVYCAAGSLEGALIASMNRGARAISLSGGFDSAVLHQKMIRSPMFLFENLRDGLAFKTWVEKSFSVIKGVAEQYSNHANLQAILPFVVGKTIHLKFVYTTGDASGQNMTTTCTWHAMLWIAENFQKETGIGIVHFVIEGNGASDKKVSQFSIIHGRGIHVVAECFLPESVINKVLRTTADDIVRCFHPSVAMAGIDGMMGYNINIANAIAAIFVATGQDLGSIPESSNGILTVEKTSDGLYLSLNLPSLVIGTVGGATHLPKQAEALELMGCKGSGKVERFARLIAGFALALEISTYSAIVSGEFAKAHEKLGRNKPVNWLLKSEINTAFIQKCLDSSNEAVTSSHRLTKRDPREISSIEITSDAMVENGIISTITNRVSKKLIGFIPVNIHYSTKGELAKQQVLIKSKALDIEVIKGLHIMAASIDPALADLFNVYRKNLEYSGGHLKEILLYEQIHLAGLNYTPEYFGKYVDEKREIYVLVQELLDYEQLEHINSQKQPQIWTNAQIKHVIRAITEIHHLFQRPEIQNTLAEVKRFEPWKSAPLYQKLVSIMYKEEEDETTKAQVAQLQQFVEDLKGDYENLHLPETIIHNDFNSRNIAIRKNGLPCIYDWELAVINIPHRDIVEFLSFVLVEGFSEEELMGYLEHHFALFTAENPEMSWEQWKQGYIYGIKEYLVTRVSFYEVAGILAKYAFSERILKNSFRMLEMLGASVSAN